MNKPKQLKKPDRPKKPRKPNIQEPQRNHTTIKYLYRDNDTDDLFLFNYYIDESDEHQDLDYEGPFYSKVEAISFLQLKYLLESNNIDPETVLLRNETYYRKNDGHLYLEITRGLSDEEYKKAIDDYNAVMEQYKKDLAAYPKRLEKYKKDKKNWDIYQTEEKLRKLRGE